MECSDRIGDHQRGHPNRAGAGSVGGERIHPRQNKGDGGSIGQDTKGETVCLEAMAGGEGLKL